MSIEEYALTVARNDRRVVEASWEMGDDERDALILAVIRAVTPVIDGSGRAPGCGCWTCDEESRKAALDAGGSFSAYISRFMIVCPECGNKRCPRATHHDNDCTGSNDSGQPGSRYQASPTDGGTA